MLNYGKRCYDRVTAFGGGVEYSPRAGFTLAEMLITIGIIGLVAAAMIPTIKVINDKLHDNARKHIEAKLAHTMKVMNAKGILEPTNSTEEFVNLLRNHLKIIKQCDKNNLDKCFTPSAILKKGANKEKEKINMLELKTGSSLGQGDNLTDNVGLVLADGVTMILTYNLNCEVDQYNNDTPVDKCLRAVYDINGLGNPNTMNEDIGLFNASLSKVSGACIEINGFCADLTDTSYSPILEAPFDGVPDEENENSVNANFWAGARNACEDKGMRLPTASEFTQMWYSGLVDLKSGYYFTSEEYSSTWAKCAQDYANTEGTLDSPATGCLKSWQYQVRCVK